MATLVNMRTLARIKADQTNSTFPTDAEYNSLINEAARDVFADMIMSGLDPAYTSVVITSTPGPQQFGGTTEAFQIRGVWYLQGGQYYELKRVNPGHVSMLRSTVGGLPEFYDLYKNFAGTNPQSIEIFPPVVGAQISIDYIPFPATLAADSDNWMGPSGSDDLVVLKAAAAGLRKEGDAQAAGVLDQQYAMKFEKVIQQVNQFSGRDGHQIRDTRHNPHFRSFEYQAWGGDHYGW